MEEKSKSGGCGMPKRYTPAQRRRIYQEVEARDGPRCQWGGSLPSVPMGHEIDHKDNNKDNDALPNLQLLCKSCNVTKRNKVAAGRSTALPTGWVCRLSTEVNGKKPVELNPSDLRERERVKTEDIGSQKEALGYCGGDVNFKANDAFEEKARWWVISYLKSHDYIGEAQAKNSMAEFAGCNPQTTQRYLDKMASLVGPLLKEKETFGYYVYRIRPPTIAIVTLQTNHANGYTNGKKAEEKVNG